MRWKIVLRAVPLDKYLLPPLEDTKAERAETQAQTQTHRRWINDFLTQESIFTRLRIEQSPVHLDVPYVGVAGGE